MCLFYIQGRRGVKRQADTTTPSTGQPSPNAILPPLPLVPPQRRESTRQVKRPKMDLPGESTQAQSKQKPLSVQLRFCSILLKEILSKKHAVTYSV